MMTFEQALDYFKRRKEQIGLADTTQAAEDMAIKALGKQIPKKVYELFSAHAIFDSEGCYLDQFDIMTYKCPICNYILASGDIDRNLCCSINYCEACGQKLDWSDEKSNNYFQKWQ